MSSQDDELHQRATSFLRAHRVHFPPILDSRIRTDDFLAASRSVVKLLELLGKVFAVARYDMNGNIEKLAKKFAENPAAYEYLEEMVLAEKGTDKIFATEGLMWLRRGLHFLLEFFERIVADEQRCEDLGPLLQQAYINTLRKYHGPIVYRMFNLIALCVPNRKNMLELIGTDGSGSSEEVLEDMRVFNASLRPCVDHLVSFYEENAMEK